MIEGTNLFVDTDTGKTYLDGVEVLTNSVKQYVGTEIEEDRYMGTITKSERELWDTLEFRGIEKIEDNTIFYVRGSAYYHDIYGTYIIRHSKEVVPILPQSLRQYFWRNGAERHKKYHQILMRAIRPADPDYRDSKDATIYIHGDCAPSMIDESLGIFYANTNEGCWRIDKTTIEQLVSEVPEIWVPLRYRAKPANLDAARVYTPKGPAKNPNLNDKRCVYVFEFSDGRVKIGVTNNPKRRMQALIGASGRNITNHWESEFVGAREAFAIESAMHNFFAKDREVGEYFSTKFYVACAKLWEWFYLKGDTNAGN